MSDQEHQARAAIGELEDARDAGTLRRLAELYATQSKGLALYSSVLVAARRLSQCRREYDDWLNSDVSDERAARLTAAGIVVFEPSITTSPKVVSEEANALLHLAREAREAADVLEPPKRARRRKGDDLPPPDLDWIASSNHAILVANLT